MKIIIWVHKSEAISGKITKWYNNCPNDLFWKDFVQVTVNKDEFTNLVDDNDIICSVPEGLEYGKSYTLEEIDKNGIFSKMKNKWLKMLHTITSQGICLLIKLRRYMTKLV